MYYRLPQVFIFRKTNLFHQVLHSLFSSLVVDNSLNLLFNFVLIINDLASLYHLIIRTLGVPRL